ncbi:MAG: DUF1318 domain-containing protein [Deltaproteobacteria bacterium]|nr:DUF1318 domain-containing protein [Deltaproteobacteria bacterium]
MKRFFISAFVLVLLGPGLWSCGGSLVEVKVDVVGERTALERQVLGTFEELDRQVMLMASVRSVDATGRLIEVPPVPPEKRRVIRALQRMKFNRDDVDRLRAMGYLGEGNNGLLVLRAAPPSGGKQDSEIFIKTIIAEENEDRLVIMKRVVQENENFKESDLEKVQKVFAHLYRDAAPAGTWIQGGEGSWTRKTGLSAR